MSDRALFAAFQKVKAQVDDAVSLTREKEARARAEEERARAEKKTRVVKAAEAKKAQAGTASISASAFSARGGFGAALADAAKSSGASFRMAAPAGGRARQPVSAPKAQESSVRGQAKSESARPASSRRPEGEAARSGRRPSGQGEQARRTAPERRPERIREREAHPKTEAGASPRRLSYEERRNPVPPFTLMPGLPVSERGEEVAKAIRDNRVVIVCGETGSGKTTQLPKNRHDGGGAAFTGMIAHTQPRRIAASSIAKRIAEELKTEPGEVVGYKVRFTDTMSPGATIKLMTDGILLAETQNDPMLRAYDTVIIDEAHERSINIDFLLGYLKRLLAKRRDLKVIVTSATIDAERFARHFEIDGRPAPVLTISGRTYPVEVRYRPIEDMDEADDKTLIGAIDDAVSELEASGRGDILVFLPGEREIREAADVLRKSRPATTEILPLFARLTAAEQERVFRPAGARRIVLSTNVAETSITVPGIRFVVDTAWPASSAIPTATRSNSFR